MVYEGWQNIEGKKVPSTSEFSKKILDYLTPKSSILDLGCGYGRLSGFFASKGFDVYGIDINKRAIEEANNNENLKNIKFSVQNAINTNFTNNFFSGIISQAVLACMDVENRKKVLRECIRILEPKGIIQIAEFGQTKNRRKYLEHAKITQEYGTIVAKNTDGSEKLRSHNFAQKKLENLIKEAKFKIIDYENPIFTTVNGNNHPGHIFLCQKSGTL